MGEIVYNPLIARIYKPCDMVEGGSCNVVAILHYILPKGLGKEFSDN